MGKTKTWLVIFALVILAAFLIFLTAQLAEVVRLLYGMNETLGRIAAFLAGALGLALVLIPAVSFLRLPKPIIPPQEESGPPYERHLERVRKRLAGNPILRESPLNAVSDLEVAIANLHNEAQRISVDWAKRVFLGTALSQNGILDMLIVLAAQISMVRRIAGVYYHRPTFRDLLYLYSNVAATAFLSYTLEEIDLSEQVEPLVESAMSGITAVPIVGAMVTPFVAATLDGAANAFLTLRVGIITSWYCAPLVRIEKKKARRQAAARAAKLLGGIVVEGAQKIGLALTKATGKKIVSAGSALAGKTKQSLKSLWPFGGGSLDRTEEGGNTP
jgi:hypothetical protein